MNLNFLEILPYDINNQVFLYKQNNNINKTKKSSLTVGMGNVCVTKIKHNPQANNINQQTKVDDQTKIKNHNISHIKINERQQQLLKLIYEDLSSRSLKGEVTLQIFLQFFHKNGYWGERLFKQFNTSSSNTITEQQFTQGIIRIFKTTQDYKIELLYKFFSDNNSENGISFINFLKMLYNYPKQDLKIILNDQQFINNQIKKRLVGLDSDLKDKKLQSIYAINTKNNLVHGRAFRIAQSQSNSQRIASKYGDRIIQQLNKSSDTSIQKQRRTTWKITVGQNDIEIQTTSIHQLVKRYARSIFKHYNISQRYGRLTYKQFRDWIIHHKNLYNVYYEGFHYDAWECVGLENKPAYLLNKFQHSTKAQMDLESSKLNVSLFLIQSILIVCKQQDNSMPVNIICLEGLSVNPIFNDEKGHGIQILHRDGIYKPKYFYFLNENIQKNWMEHLKFYRGTSINQLYDIRQKIGTGKFSVVYHCVQRQTNQDYAIKVIQAYKLDKQAKKILAHESSIMSVMSHPLLVFFKQSITTKTHIYIVTQLVKGKDLFDLVRDLKIVEQTQAMYIIQQVMIGVKYIHSLGIVHRDLKPQNIMVQLDEKCQVIGRIKIIDFGFANYVSKLRQLSKQQLWVGTPNYIAPQILREQYFSEKIDNFAIGAILFYLLSGNLPFNSVDIATILHKTMQGKYTFNDKKWNRISNQAKDLISRLLQNQPTLRISLNQALKHPWFNKFRATRHSTTSYVLQKTIEERQKIYKAQKQKKIKQTQQIKQMIT